MSESNRLYQLALGGCLAALLLIAPVLAQQEVKELGATVNESQGVAGETPPPEKDSGESAYRQKTPAADPLPPPPPVEREIDSEPACGPRCEAAQQREKSDLVAQQRMADSTRDIVIVTEWQLYVGGAGIVLLIVTLGLNVRATNAAVDANRIARKSSERQLRAYVHPTDSKVIMEENGIVRANVRIQNAGQTPAYKLISRVTVSIGPYPLQESPSSSSKDGQRVSRGVLQPKCHVNGTVEIGPLGVEAQKVISAGKAVIFVHGDLSYLDVFDNPQTSKFRLMYTGQWGGQKPLDICDEGNDAT